MSKLARISRSLLAGSALLLTGLAMTSQPVDAHSHGCRGTGVAVTYYSNATLTKEVGSYSTTCSGVCSGSGRVTPYYVEYYYPCPPPPDQTN